MKKVSYQELREGLATFLDEAADGNTIVVTRHSRPVAMLVPPGQEHVHVGSRFGRGGIRPLFKAATRGRYLEILAEDRDEDR